MLLTYSDNDSKKNFVNSFLNYSKKIKSIDTQVFTGLQYSNFDQGLWSNVQNNFNNTQFELHKFGIKNLKSMFFQEKLMLRKSLKTK